MSTRNRIVITGKLLMHSERIDHIPFTLKERSKSTMQVLYRICCGLDVHVKTVVACLLKATGERIVRTFGTMTDDLLQLADWLKANGCTHVAMESTGVYWKPVFNILEGSFSVILANPYHIKAVPGRKTDVKDCERSEERRVGKECRRSSDLRRPSAAWIDPSQLYSTSGDPGTQRADALPDDKDRRTGTLGKPDSKGSRVRQYQVGPGRL